MTAQEDARDGLRRLANVETDECIERLTGGEAEQQDQLAELESDFRRPREALLAQLDKCGEPAATPTPEPVPAAPGADPAVTTRAASVAGRRAGVARDGRR